MSPYNTDLSLTHPPYALFCSAQTSLLLPPAHHLQQTTPYIRCPSASAKFTATGEEAEGVATIGVAVKTLRFAEYLTPTLMEQLK